MGNFSLSLRAGLGVFGITGTSSNLSAIASTIATGREFNLKIVVEGVETTEQMQL